MDTEWFHERHDYLVQVPWLYNYSTICFGSDAGEVRKQWTSFFFVPVISIADHEQGNQLF